MSKLVIITGDLATGKSTFAGVVSQKFGVMHLTKDLIKETLADEIGFSNREENLRLSKATFKLFLILIKEAFMTGNNLIVEANFHQEELDTMIKSLGTSAENVLTIRLSAKSRIIHQRYLRRIKEENRHRAHLALDLSDLAEFEKYVKKDRGISLPGVVIEVNADNFDYQTDYELLNSIKRFFGRSID